jgi:RND family efflux transporter MFP subunit
MTSKYNIKYFISITTLALSLTSTVVAEEFDGVLGWSKRVELSTPVNGVVQKVFALPGKLVAKGEVLIRLDPRVFKADLKHAKAKLKNTNEQTLEVKRELDRQIDMYDRTMLSDHDLQIAKNNFTAAQSQYFQAQAALTKAKINLEYSAIRAPFNAIVINTAAVKGQVVASEVIPPILIVVAEAQRMQARFYVETDKVNSLVVNQGVKVNVAGQSYQGKILNIALEPDKLKAGYYAVDVIFDTKEKILRAGQKAEVKL